MLTMSARIDLSQLSAFFSDEDIEWKPIVVSRKTNKGLAAAYVNNRAIMDRLDDVCGPENWKNEFMPGPNGGVVCGISIRVERGESGTSGGFAEWITKWDGAENTDIEAVKGGLSSSMRRAAVQWGIGRYLYKLPSQWVAVDDNGRFKQPPRVPAAFRPKPPETSASGDGATTSQAPVPAPATPQREAVTEQAAPTPGLPAPQRGRPTPKRQAKASQKAPAPASRGESRRTEPRAERTPIDDEARQYMMPSRPPGR